MLYRLIKRDHDGRYICGGCSNPLSLALVRRVAELEAGSKMCPECLEPLGIVGFEDPELGKPLRDVDSHQLPAAPDNVEELERSISLTPNEYQRRALGKEADQEKLREWVHSQGPQATRLVNACRGLADDCGELNGATKKWLEYQQPLDKTNVLEEIGDCLWRLAQACAAIDKTLEDAMRANLRKLYNVRYKDTVCNPEDAANRDRVAERRAVAEDDGVQYE